MSRSISVGVQTMAGNVSAKKVALPQAQDASFLAPPGQSQDCLQTLSPLPSLAHERPGSTANWMSTEQGGSLAGLHGADG